MPIKRGRKMDDCLKRKKPIISVIMGVYNIAGISTFFKSIDSILNQTFSDFEFIICDDGSTDETANLLKKIAKQDKRIRLICNPTNLGLAASLNHCIELSQGEFIARQDADDYSTLNRFEKQYDFLKKNPKISFVGSFVALFNEKDIYRVREFPILPKKHDFLFTMPFVHGALLFRREALLQSGMYRVSKETKRAEDYDLLMRMYAHGFCGANLSEILYYFLEDDAAIKRRKYKYRIDEAKVRWRGFKALHLFPKAFPYVIKPLIVGIIPKKILLKLKSFYTKID